FDLTFCAPKSVSLIRALRSDDVVAKEIADAHGTALLEAMEYLAAHAGYTRVHNPHTGDKDLVRLPGLTAIAYQHETSPRDTATSRRSTATGRRSGPADWARSRRCAGADPRTPKAGKQTRWSSPERCFAQVYAEPLHDWSTLRSCRCCRPQQLQFRCHTAHRRPRRGRRNAPYHRGQLARIGRMSVGWTSNAKHSSATSLGRESDRRVCFSIRRKRCRTVLGWQK